MPQLNPTTALKNILKITTDHPAVRVVIENFRHESKAIYNIRRIEKLDQKSLYDALSIFEFSFYGRKIDRSKIIGQPKKTIAGILCDKIKMHLPKHCNECNEEFCIPLDDPLMDVRKYCLLCCQPSHACPKNLINKDNEPKFPLWLCSECMENRKSANIQFLEDLPPPPAQAQEVPIQETSPTQVNSTQQDLTLQPPSTDLIQVMTKMTPPPKKNMPNPYLN